MGSQADRFRRLYDEHAVELLAYARRRTRSPQDAADVVADTFLTTWRRLDDVPVGAQARLWLFGTARRSLANHRRGLQRRDRLRRRLAVELGAVLPAPAPPDHPGVHAALGRLSAGDRELLRLSAWEQLQPAEIAIVLGISAEAARTRLSRARRRLRGALEGPPDPVRTTDPTRRTRVDASKGQP